MKVISFECFQGITVCFLPQGIIGHPQGVIHLVPLIYLPVENQHQLCKEPQVILPLIEHQIIVFPYSITAIPICNRELFPEGALKVEIKLSLQCLFLFQDFP